MRRRIGVSEVVGSLVMIAITLIAGTAAFGYVNGQTGVAAGQIGNSVANNVNYLREKTTIALVNFDNNTGVSVYIFNNGAEVLTIASLIIVGPTCVGSTNCLASTQGVVTVSCAGATCSISGTASNPAPAATCTGKAVAGLSNIALDSMARVSISLSGCNFVFAQSPSLPATTSPPLTNYFTVKATGQFGSTASTIMTR